MSHGELQRCFSRDCGISMTMRFFHIFRADVRATLLTRVGDNWEPKVWVNRSTFDLARAWAGVANP